MRKPEFVENLLEKPANFVRRLGVSLPWRYVPQDPQVQSYYDHYTDWNNIYNLSIWHRRSEVPPEFNSTLEHVEQIAVDFPNADKLGRQRFVEKLEGYCRAMVSAKEDRSGYNDFVLWRITETLNYPPIRFEGFRRRVENQEWSRRVDDKDLFRQLRSLESTKQVLLEFSKQPIDSMMDEDEREDEWCEREFFKHHQSGEFREYHETAFAFEQRQYDFLREGIQRGDYSYAELFTTPQEFRRLGTLLQVWWSKEQYFDALRYQQEHIEAVESVKGYGTDSFTFKKMIKQMSAGLESIQGLPRIPEVIDATKLLKEGLLSTNRAYVVLLREKLRDLTTSHYKDEFQKIRKVISTSGFPFTYYGITTEELVAWSKLSIHPLDADLPAIRRAFVLTVWRNKVRRFFNK